MKLYYSAGSCAMSCHIALEESGLKYEGIEVDWENSSDPGAAQVAKLNALGTVPVLITDDGKQLDQNIAIHTYIADKVPDKKLLPPNGTFERAEAVKWLSFVSADMHKAIGALFTVNYVSKDKAVQDAYRQYAMGRAKEILAYLDNNLAGKDFLLGKNFCLADAYAFVVAGWTKWLEIPLTPYKNIQSYMGRVAARPAVAKVIKVEGLE